MIEHYISQRCPECGWIMEYTDEDHYIGGPWTEATDMVVIPVICPKCNWSDVIHLRPSRQPVHGTWASLDLGAIDYLSIASPEKKAEIENLTKLAKELIDDKGVEIIIPIGPGPVRTIKHLYLDDIEQANWGDGSMTKEDEERKAGLNRDKS